MPTTNPGIDAYIKKSPEFAQPILTHMRALIHKACPEVEEQIKWSVPSFEYKGPMMGIAAFKQHCSLGFWKASIMKDKEILFGEKTFMAAGNLGRITSLKDLPKDKVIIGWIKEAMKLNDENIKVPKDKPRKHEKKELVIPPYFITAVKKNKKAWATFENFSYSQQKEYVEWITEAKTEETRSKRLSQAIEWMTEGKTRNWKYQK
jgi:uncharacterized protein YdeI (YjbR/CyaY-like superfamily)